MKTAQNRTQRLTWSLLASTLALSLMLGLSLALSHFQALAQSTTAATADSLSIVKEVSKTQAEPGETLFYTITIENLTWSSIDAWMTDTLPAELTNVSEPNAPVGNVGLANGVITWSHSMYPNSLALITFDAQVTTEITAYAEIENVAQLSGNGEQFTSAVTTTVVADVGNLDNGETYKQVSANMAEPGDVLDYTIWIRNNEFDPVPNTRIVDKLPEGLILVSGPNAPVGTVVFEDDTIIWTHNMDPFGGAQVTYSALVDPNLSADRWITNTAQFSAPGQSFTRTAVISVHRRAAQLLATKSVNPAQARPGEYLTYTVHLVNNGDGDTPGLWMTDELPSEVNFVAGTLTASWGSFDQANDVITWTSITDPSSTLLLPQEEVTITYTVQITGGLQDNPYFTNTAHITGAGDLVLAQAPAQAITLLYVYLPIMARAFPPVPVWSGPIPTPEDRAYTISWDDITIDYDHYVLQQSRFSDFAAIENSWQTESTSKQVESAYCRYYYRVRVDKLDYWGAGPWSYTASAQPTPPAITLNSISNADHDGSYTVSWSLESYDDTVDRYVLQEATDANFGNLTGAWTIDDPETTSQAFAKGVSGGGTYYYRVRADDDDCWTQGSWSGTQSTVVYIRYDFNSGCSTWAVREHTGDDGPPGTDWFNVYCDEGYYKMWMNDRWEHIVSSPLVMSPDGPFEIQSKIFFWIRKWTHGYAFIFGANEEMTQYYRVNVVYLQDGWMKYQVKRCYKDHPDEEKVLTMGLPGADGGGYIEVSKSILNGQQWNVWRIQRNGEHIKVIVNSEELVDVTDNYYTGAGYFGMMLSTWEFKPAEIHVDYYNIIPLQ